MKVTIDKSNPVSGSTGQIPAVSASAGREATRTRKNAAPKREAVEKKPESAPAPDPKIAKSAEKSGNRAKTTEVDSGKYNDYRVNSDYELIITVKNRQTNEEIRQIPSKEHQAVKQAISETIDHLIDKTI
jgi:uncharacterized FlaG/YvyC family protein